jgi:hypothetical protein
MHVASRRRRFSLVSVLTILMLAGVFGAGCGPDQNDVTGPSDLPQLDSRATVFGMGSPRVLAAMDVQVRHTPTLMSVPSVVGTATSVDENGTPFVVVYTEVEIPDSHLPLAVDGLAVVQEVSGKIVAMKGAPGGGGGVSHTAIQTPPIQLGTSGGWRYDLANGYCCGGTLGSLITKGGKQYILSNYHVLEADIVSGGNSRVATTGDPVIQPALIDVSCNANNAQNVATLVVSSALPNSNVDAAIAEVISGMVRTDGAILQIGTLSSSIVAASVGQAVKKAGRTTGLTRSSVDGLNATVSVAYENECAGGSAFTKTFTGQIIIKNRRSGFLAGGDSGSLMVEDVTTNPRAIGLLFAGSSTLAVANPIGEVLGFFGASMVGQ